MHPDLLIIFCKSPRPGDVKRRLSPPLSPAQACAAYVAMVLDTEMIAAALTDVDVWFACPGAPSETLRGMLRPGTAFLEQDGPDLGQRMARAFDAAFAAGYRNVVIIGSDSPDLPVSYVETAFARLREDPGLAVFGPTLDGGYYLVGLGRPRPALFQDISWSMPAVWDETQRVAEHTGVPLCALPRWQDVDTWRDLGECLMRGGAMHLAAIFDFGLLDPELDRDPVPPPTGETAP